MTSPDYIQAHQYSGLNRELIMKSDQCGCFYCLETFEPTEITEWVDETNSKGATALCPRCGIDSVIGSASGFPITRAFLNSMRAYWF